MLSLSICALIDTVSSVYPGGYGNSNTGNSGGIAGIGNVSGSSVVHEVLGFIMSLVLDVREVSRCVIIYIYIYYYVLTFSLYNRIRILLLVSLRLVFSIAYCLPSSASHPPPLVTPPLLRH